MKVKFSSDVKKSLNVWKILTSVVLLTANRFIVGIRPGMMVVTYPNLCQIFIENMATENTIAFESIEGMFNRLGEEWHSSEYYISPDRHLPDDPSGVIFRPAFYGLFLCVEGWLDIKINSELIHVEPWYIFALSPDNIYQRIEQSPDCRGRVVLFTKDFLLNNILDAYQLKSFLFLTSNGSVCIQLEKEDSEPLLQLYDILKNKRNSIDSPYHLEIIRSLFFGYLYEAARVYQKGKVVTHLKFSRDAELNFKFQELLAQNDRLQHTLKFYADSLFITPKYLIRAIKNASGKSPGKLIDEAIVAESKLLLKDTRLSMTAIADELHFSDQASFSKFFKKNTGLTPLSYRREL